MSLSGSTVVILGGSSGIGLETARAAAQAGARVTIAARSLERLARAAAELGGEIDTAELDVTEEPAVRTFLQRLPRLDHLLVTAGSVVHAPRLEPEIETLRPALDVRFWGSLAAAKYAAPRMGEGGSITFTSGSAGRRPAPGTAADSASCGAVEALARALALDLAPVRVNALCPGFIDTPLLRDALGERCADVLRRTAEALPVRRVGRAQDVAHAALFLMTNGYVTGTVLTVDGGQSLI